MPAPARRAGPGAVLADTEEFPPLGGRVAGPSAAPGGGRGGSIVGGAAPGGQQHDARAVGGGVGGGGGPVVSSSAVAEAGRGGGAAAGDTARDPLNGYGMLGVLKIISRSNADLNALALGYDLTSLGLSLNSPDYLYTNFCCPWRDEPPVVQPDYKLPQCYFMSPPHLRFQMFQRFELATLFYIFYSMPRDVLQLAAAQELYNRGWRFHKEHKLWLQRAPDTQPTVKTRAYERGDYVVWDPTHWRQDRRDDFVLVYDQLEDRMSVAAPQQRPPAAQGQPPSQAPGPAAK
eukprot:TRINITY_DN65325_c0_g1_i1.p1 TRINITY_DN65325_c0_g1~~TRINITY_DN65325_c0_g1_i1.p1  ORF type:complete len:328 (+),score=87.24 TRINITY_DN65325_c0_g1_i1:118-984(+)